MSKNTNIEMFLEHLAKGVEAGEYTKATFPKALEKDEWAQFAAELSEKSTAVDKNHIAPFQFVGILPPTSRGEKFTYSDLATSLVQRLELIKFAKDNIKDFTAVRH